MSLNEEKFEQYLNQSRTISEIKDELIYVILTSLNQIVTQVNDLAKHTEDLCGNLDKEIHSISFKLKTLQEKIIQLTDVIAHKSLNEVLSMEVWKSRKTLPNITVETQQVYSCTSLPVNIFKRNNATIVIPLLALPSYYKNDMKDSSTSNGSFHSCLYCSKLVKTIVPVSKKQARKKNIQKNLDHDSETSCFSVDHIPASGCSVSHYSNIDQPEGGSSLYIFPLNNSKLQGECAANNLPGEQEHLHYDIGHMSNSCPRILYGTGKRNAMFSKPPSIIHCKRDVFVNPLAPEAPPLPSDRLLQLASSKRPTAPRIVSSISSPVTSSLVVLETATTSACLKTTSNIDLKMPSEFTSMPAPHECLELQPGDLSPQSRDHLIISLLFPSAISLCNISWDSALNLIDSTLPRKSQQYCICQLMKSFLQSTKTAKSSPESPSKSRSASVPPQNQASNTSGSSSAQLPRSSRVPCSVSVSASSSHKIQMSSNLSSPKRSVSNLTKLIEAQSRLHVTNSKGHLYSPPLKLSTKVTSPGSPLSLMKSTSPSSQISLGITQHSNPNRGNQNPLSVLPIVSKARKTLVEASRTAVQLRKTQKKRPRPELPEKEAAVIRDRRKAMGYSSGKSDSENEWA